MPELYLELVATEATLRESLLTEAVMIDHTSATSQYRLRSYRLLSHAEIEAYVEAKILEKVDTEFDKWKNEDRISRCISCLVAYHRITFPPVATRLSDVSTKNDFWFRLNSVVAEFKKEVKSNNGVKEENLIPLLIKIGIDYKKLDQTLLNELSSFGQNRGATAHNSSKVHQLINPDDEITTVKRIIDQLREVDNLINKIGES